jgi:Nas2 N_terminal domain
MDAAALKQSLSQLDVKRKSLEMEGEAIISELMAKPESGGEPMGIDTPLVDPEGYPRADIDVYRARDLRHRFNMIKTDRKELMKQIDTLLQQLALIQVRN